MVSLLRPADTHMHTNLLKTFCCHELILAARSWLNNSSFKNENKHSSILFYKYCKRIVCDLWMKEWRATQKNKDENQRGSDDDDDGALRCKVLMGISAAGLKEQSRCVGVCVRIRERERERAFNSLSAVLPLRNSNCDPCSVKICSPLGPA